MRQTLTAAGMLVAALMAITATAQQKSETHRPARVLAETAQAAAAAQPHAEDEQAIRLATANFLQAYNAGDAKAVAALFVEQAEIVNEEGESVRGQAAIEGTFADIFQTHPKSQIKVTVQSVRFVSPTVALEDGISTVTHPSGEPAEQNRYTVVRLKQDGRWRMASARDLPDEEAVASEEIKQLGGLIGEWVTESHSELVIASYRWADDRRSILSEFKVQVGGRPASSGSERITWDPLAKKLHSWMVSSEGELAEGIWTRSGSQWLVKMSGVTGDGKPVSATNVLTRVAKDRMHLAIARSGDRQRVDAEHRGNLHRAKTAQTHVANPSPQAAISEENPDEHEHKNVSRCDLGRAVGFQSGNGRPWWPRWWRRRPRRRRWWRRPWWWRRSRRRRRAAPRSRRS